MASEDDYGAFVAANQRRLWHAVLPVAGPETAADAVADALVWAWEHWDRVAAMDNPEGYLYRMAQRRAWRQTDRSNRHPLLPRPEPDRLPEVEPGLLPALEALTSMQRTVVWLVEAQGLGLTETSRLLDVSVSTVRNHLARGMAALRAALEVEIDA